MEIPDKRGGDYANRSSQNDYSLDDVKNIVKCRNCQNVQFCFDPHKFVADNYIYLRYVDHPHLFKRLLLQP